MEVLKLLLNRIYRLSDINIQDRNFVNNYLPFRTKGNEFDFSVISGVLISHLMKLKIGKNYSFDQFKQDCLVKVSGYLSDPDFKNKIDEMYFQDQTIIRVSPEFSIFNVEVSSNIGNKHMFEVFKSMLNGKLQKESVQIEGQVNFLEEIFLEELKNHVEPFEIQQTCEPYLPFLAKLFHQDLSFISSYPEYLLSELDHFLRLYAFLYCSQLALNINDIKNEPESKPLYFILDIEKASQERSQIKNYGYGLLQEKVTDLFPILSLLEYFNNIKQEEMVVPLWRFGRALSEANNNESQLANASIKSFLEKFVTARNLNTIFNEQATPLDTLKNLIEYAKAQFNKNTGTSRWDIYVKYKVQFNKLIASHFIQRRGRAGNILIVNQDNLLLLTNLAIGMRESLRFQELLKAFQERGIWFDKQSEQTLIKFYERIGNVEKMSDSGDAVYVRKTL